MKFGYSQEHSNRQISDEKNAYFALMKYNNRNNRLEIFSLVLCKSYPQFTLQFNSHSLDSKLCNLVLDKNVRLCVYPLLMFIVVISNLIKNSLYEHLSNPFPYYRNQFCYKKYEYNATNINATTLNTTTSTTANNTT